MSIDEQARRGLERRLEEVLGEEHALTMMQLLPPEELATKLDLENLEHRLGRRMNGFDTRMERFDTRMERFEGRMDGLERKIDDLGPHLIAVMDGKNEGMEGRLVAMFHQQLAAQTRVFFFSTAGLMLTLAAVLRAG